MGFLDELLGDGPPEKSESQKDYERGQHDGSRAGAVDELGHMASLGIGASEEYNKGFDHGRQNKPADMTLSEHIWGRTSEPSKPKPTAPHGSHDSLSSARASTSGRTGGGIGRWFVIAGVLAAGYLFLTSDWREWGNSCEAITRRAYRSAVSQVAEEMKVSKPKQNVLESPEEFYARLEPGARKAGELKRQFEAALSRCDGR